MPSVWHPRRGCRTASEWRRASQTVRLNKRLVHVQVLAEERGKIDADWLNVLLDAVAPDVFEDGPTISCAPVRDWPEDSEGLVLAVVADRKREYFTPAYDIRTSNGQRRDDNARWVMAKVFSAASKYVDDSV